eukprot:6184304-Pleurochrysis_carterae.AAC.2
MQPARRLALKQRSWLLLRFECDISSAMYRRLSATSYPSIQGFDIFERLDMWHIASAVVKPCAHVQARGSVDAPRQARRARV